MLQNGLSQLSDNAGFFYTAMQGCTCAPMVAVISVIVLYVLTSGDEEERKKDAGEWNMGLKIAFLTSFYEFFLAW